MKPSMRLKYVSPAKPSGNAQAVTSDADRTVLVEGLPLFVEGYVNGWNSRDIIEQIRNKP